MIYFPIKGCSDCDFPDYWGVIVGTTCLRRGVGDVVVAVTRGVRAPVECGGAYAPAWVSQAGVFSA